MRSAKVERRNNRRRRIVDVNQVQERFRVGAQRLSSFQFDSSKDSPWSIQAGKADNDPFQSGSRAMIRSGSFGFETGLA
ncbi:MAG: hypothetical protein NVSMB9_04550 [Isosphaeraceae bacterium]